MVVLSLVLVGWFFFFREERVSLTAEDKGLAVDRMSGDKVVKNQTTMESKPEWIKRYLTPGVITKNIWGETQISSVNGYFVRLESAGDKDQYLVLRTEDKELPKLHLVFSPKKEKGLFYPTQVNILTPGLAEDPGRALRSLTSDINQLNPEFKKMIFTDGSWLSALVYVDQTGQAQKDETGAYYVRAITYKGGE